MIKKKKNAFFTFCFSLLPGAGQMYMGFMKRGISLMSSFFLVIFLSTWLNLGPLLLFMPIVWFFSFFDTHNLRSMPDDMFNTFQDEYIIIPEFVKKGVQSINGKYRSVVAVVLIVVGCILLWNNFYYLIEGLLPHFLSNTLFRLGRIFPQTLVGIVIIAIGVYLIRGKKRELDAVQITEQFDDRGGIQ